MMLDYKDDKLVYITAGEQKELFTLSGRVTEGSISHLDLTCCGALTLKLCLEIRGETV